MPTCPAGHDSAADDFCDVCGMRIGATSQTPAMPAAAAVGPPAETCPQCGAGRTGKFCEACGFDYASGHMRGTVQSPPALRAAASPGQVVAPSGNAGPAGWIAVANPDRGYFDSVRASGGPDAAAVRFPGHGQERVFRLSGQVMRIGRRSASRALEPEIDLTGPPTDPGISHMHAVLVAEPDGGWAILDPGSANGTQVNGGEILTGRRVPLRDGDRIGVGAWTVLTIRIG